MEMNVLSDKYFNEESTEINYKKTMKTNQDQEESCTMEVTE